MISTAKKLNPQSTHGGYCTGSWDQQLTFVMQDKNGKTEISG